MTLLLGLIDCRHDGRPAAGGRALHQAAANGDQLFATTAGGEDQFVPPNVSHVTLVATISGGTGRFTGATGTFTIHFVQTIDFVAATSSGPGSFDGQIAINK